MAVTQMADDGKRDQGLDEGKSGAPAEILPGPALRGCWLEQPLFPPSAK